MNYIKIAANAMSISERYLRNCINEYPEGYYIWEPERKGKSAFVDFDGKFLVATHDIPFKIHYDNFRKGVRTIPEKLIREIDEKFSAK